MNGVVSLYIGTVLVGLLNVAAYKIMAFQGADGLYDYSLIRRYIGFGLPLFSLGFGVIIPITVARTKQEELGKRLIVLQAVLGIFLGLLLCCFFLLFPRFAYILGLQGDFFKVVFVILISFGLSINGSVFGYFRGLLDFSESAKLNFWVNGVALFIATILMVLNPLLGLMGWLFITMVFNLRALYRLRIFPGLGYFHQLYSLRVYMTKAFGRVPGDIALVFLFTIPITLSIGVMSEQEAAVLAYFFVILGLINSVSSPLSVVLLPKMAESLSINKKRKIVFLSLGMGVFFGGVVFTFLTVFYNALTLIALSPLFMNEAWIFADLALAAYGYSIFLFTRSIIDASFTFPFVSLILIISSVILVVLLGVLNGVDGIIESISIAFLSLGLLSFFGGICVLFGRQMGDS